MGASYRDSVAGSVSAASSMSLTIDALADDLLFVMIDSYGVSSAPSSVFDDFGGTYSPVESALWDSSGSRSSLYVRDDPVPIGQSVEVFVNLSSAGEIYSQVMAVAGMTRAGLSAILQSAKAENQAGGSAPTITLPGNCDSANMTIGSVGSFASATPAPTGWTERLSGQWLETVSRNSGFSGDTLTWGASFAWPHAVIAAELDTSLSPTSGDGTVTENDDQVSGYAGPEVFGVVSEDDDTVAGLSSEDTSGDGVVSEDDDVVSGSSRQTRYVWPRNAQSFDVTFDRSTRFRYRP